MPHLIAYAEQETVVVSGLPRDTHGPGPLGTGELLVRRDFPSNTKRRSTFDGVKSQVARHADATHRRWGCGFSGGDGYLWVRRAGFDGRDAIDVIRAAIAPASEA
mgnify:CR=1 FL=1|jgi:hypothetical protein